MPSRHTPHRCMQVLSKAGTHLAHGHGPRPNSPPTRLPLPGLSPRRPRRTCPCSQEGGGGCQAKGVRGPQGVRWHGLDVHVDRTATYSPPTAPGPASPTHLVGSLGSPGVHLLLSPTAQRQRKTEVCALVHLPMGLRTSPHYYRTLIARLSKGPGGETSSTTYLHMSAYLAAYLPIIFPAFTTPPVPAPGTMDDDAYARACVHRPTTDDCVPLICLCLALPVHAAPQAGLVPAPDRRPPPGCHAGPELCGVADLRRHPDRAGPARHRTHEHGTSLGWVRSSSCSGRQ